MRRGAPYFYLVVAGLAALALVVGGALWVWAGENVDRLSRLSVALSYGLLVGAALAATGLFEQIREARRSRQDALRPVLVVAEADWGEPPRLTIRNIGTGAALDTGVQISLPGPMSTSLDVRDEFIAAEGREIEKAGFRSEIGYPYRFALAAGGTVSVPLFVLGPTRVSADPGERVRFRLQFQDVFGNLFTEPREDSPGHAWFRDEIPEEEEYRLRFR